MQPKYRCTYCICFCKRAKKEPFFFFLLFQNISSSIYQILSDCTVLGTLLKNLTHLIWLTNYELFLQKKAKYNTSYYNVRLADYSSKCSLREIVLPS